VHSSQHTRMMRTLVVAVDEAQSVLKTENFDCSFSHDQNDDSIQT
jgi:hypothetical protein